MQEALAATKNIERIQRDRTFNAMRFGGVPKSLASMLRVSETHRTAMRHASQIAGMLSLRSPAWLAQQRVIERTMPMRPSPGWLAQRRAMEQMMPLMSTPTMKRIPHEMRLMSTRLPLTHEWAVRRFPSLPTVGVPPRFRTDAYDDAGSRVQVVPLRKKRVKARIVHKHDVQVDTAPQFPPDPDFGLRQGRW